MGAPAEGPAGEGSPRLVGTESAESKFRSVKDALLCLALQPYGNVSVPV